LNGQGSQAHRPPDWLGRLATPSRHSALFDVTWLPSQTWTTGQHRMLGIVLATSRSIQPTRNQVTLSCVLSASKAATWITALALRGMIIEKRIGMLPVMCGVGGYYISSVCVAISTDQPQYGSCCCQCKTLVQASMHVRPAGDEPHPQNNV
jgi:hypothetical protein